MSEIASSFASRFELAERASGGLVLDTETGAFYRLNKSAIAICRALAATGSRDETIGRVASQFAIERTTAAHDVDGVLQLVASGRTERNAENPVRFDASNDSLTMRWDGTPVLRIAIPDLGATWLANDRCGAAEALLWAAPHLLVLSDVFVLHASAVSRKTGVTCVVGASGAGKTTTAAALVTGGYTAVSEDLVVIRPGHDGAEVLRDAEATVRAWVLEHANALVAGERIDGARLRSLLPTARSPLRDVVFLESRHRGEAIEATALDEIEGMARLLANSFAEVGSAEIFRRVFRHATALGSSVRYSTWSAPEGLGALASAVRQLQ